MEIFPEYLDTGHRILAQAAAEQDVKVTAGGALAGMLVIMTLVASLVTIAVWVVRHNNRIPVLPTARRKPLRVPAALLLCGIVLSTAMAAIAFSQSTGGQNEVLPGQNGAAPNDSASAESDDATEPEGSSGEEAVAAPASTDADGEDADGEDADGEDADGEDTDGEDTDGAAEPVPPAPAFTEGQFMQMMLSTLFMNTMIFSIFGLTILLMQQMHSRRTRHANDVTYDALGHVLQAADATAGLEQNVHDDSYDMADPYVPPNPFLNESQAPLADNDDGAPAERWDFKAELRFAAEAFLAAYLPTAVLRIVVTVLMPEAPSHPFLEMIDQGVSWTIGAMIFLMAVFVAPIVEELLYRVTILGGFMQQRAPIAGWVVSSILFGFAHGFPDSIALLPLAFVIGYTYMRRRSYRTVILIHFLFNGFNMLIAGLSML